MAFIIVPINICQHIPIMKLGFQNKRANNGN